MEKTMGKPPPLKEGKPDKLSKVKMLSRSYDCTGCQDDVRRLRCHDAATASASDDGDLVLDRMRAVTTAVKGETAERERKK
ncbi:hypothetical protein LOK49_LG06G02729 [Camellia lanceoleosa]|uniref:Uncharacterized protein n=1 Tax=Camellia lanceoleosa TaxID=1840588 RepID=A0ACC0HID7_9ERIC|nr:hypothetical protein LOK49_LG06G02729 [Camellia lanceoleosa]